MRYRLEAVIVIVFVITSFLFFYTILKDDRNEYLRARDQWVSTISGVAPQLMSEGNLLKIQSLLRSQSRFPMSITDMNENILVSNLEVVRSFASFEKKILIMSSRPVGYLFFDPANNISLLDQKYGVYICLWAALLVGTLMVLSRQRDLFYLTKLSEELSLGQVNRPKYYPKRFAPLLDSAINYGSVVAKNAEMNLEIDHNRELMKVVLKVAHDIRSPLSALSVLTGRHVQMPEEQRELIKNVVQRTNDIADNILVEYKERDKTLHKKLAHLSGEMAVENIDHLLQMMVSEKEAQYEKDNLTIRYEVEAAAKNVLASISRGALSRLLSNMINNSVEASEGQSEISIHLSLLEKNLKIVLKDKGRGMSAEIVSALGRRQRSTSKETGHGFGLLHAMDVIEAWSGTMVIHSVVGQGTEITISLPIVTGKG